MNDKELIKIYSVGLFMLALLDEWSTIERIGSVAKIYNTITKKHNNFHVQIHDVEHGKKKKYSHKCNLFIHASALSIAAWEESVKYTKNLSISANTALHNLYRLNSDGLSRVYGLTEEIFKSIDKTKQTGAVFSSCKAARIMTDAINKTIDKKINDVTENIYTKKNKLKESSA
ncbi:hypothetical protein [Sulfurimonas indica]|uniref:hypothetical protein n=1 Tax=Sulfurimonas TaxID=202746 RepID=UPI001264B479|nr:hypothetical protein [Sulfurimonas indica]